jgi:uncharacterized protein (TIGR03086 family)
MAQQNMPNPADLYEAAVKNTRGILAGVKDSQLNDPTPCAEWNVQALVNHLLEGAGYAAGALSGGEPQAPPKAGSTVEAYDIATSNVLKVMRDPATAQRRVQAPFGEISGMEFMFGSFMDTLVHGWDLAKATGQNTSLPEDLVQVCAGIFTKENVDPLRGAAFGPAIEAPAGASTQTVMLAGMGRKA